MTSLRSTSWFIFCLTAALSAAGCSTDTTSGESGSLNVSLELEGDVQINQVDWLIAGNGMEPMSGTINTSAPGATASVEVFGLPPGENYEIIMTATSVDGETSCSGSAEFDVEVDVSTNVMVMLNCKPPRDLGGVRVNGKFNICADLLKVVVSPLQTSVGNDIDLAAAGDDYEGDDFEFLWEATGGSIDDPSAAETVYTCEEAGNQEVRVIVSDDGFDYCLCDWTVAIRCVEAELCDGVMCDEDEICVDEACVPIGECTEDSDCGPGEICLDNECIPDPDLCTGDEDCGPGEICLDNMCVPDPDFCLEDEDCDLGEICLDNACVPDPDFCLEDEECDTGDICVEGECVPDVDCIDDDDCGDGDLCTEDICTEGVCLNPDVDCDDQNECTANMCEPETGNCDSTNVEDGLPCDDDNGSCLAGECKTNELLGNEFVLVFEDNYTASTQTLFLSGPTATDGVVSITRSAFTEPFSIVPGSVTTVVLPSGSELTSNDVIEVGAGVVVSSDEQITVYGLNQLSQTTDAFAALPTEILGRRHRVMAWSGGINGESQLAVGAIPGPGGNLTTPTNVTITPSAAAGARPAGVPFTITLNPLDAYQLQSTGNLTGTLIESDRPVAVFAGNECANIPNQNTGYCDHVVEQILPVNTWGTEVLSVPLATRTQGDTFRILTDTDGTTVTLAGAAPESISLNAGEFAERLLEGSYRITADQPILVAQYSNGTEWDGVTSDPFMMLIPTAEQFVQAYTFATPGMGFPSNWANVVAETLDAAGGAVLLDGASVPAEAFTSLAGTDFSAAQLPISVGSHTLTAPNPLGLYVYGYAGFDSYGYPGGFSIAAVPVP
jgi:hypothetical protein